MIKVASGSDFLVFGEDVKEFNIVLDRCRMLCKLVNHIAPQIIFMKNVAHKILLLFCLAFLASHLFAQKHFNLTVQLPGQINIEKVDAWLEDGKASHKITPQLKAGNQLVLEGDYNTEYAAVTRSTT